MISGIEWVPMGVADPVPKRYEMSTAELEMIRLMENVEHDDPAQVEARIRERLTEKSTKVAKTNNLAGGTKRDHGELPADLRMDEYSSDDDDNDRALAIGDLLVGKQPLIDDDDDDDEPVPDDKGEGSSHPDNEGDNNNDARKDTDADDHDNDDDSDDDDNEDDLEDVPDTREYMPVDVEGLESMGLSQVGNMGGMNIDDLVEGDIDDDDSEAEDVRITPDDALIIVAKTEEDFASLEIHVYDQRTGNLFVHHDIPLPSFPLALAHGQVSSHGNTGNYCAVGTFDTGIEIWNLDVLNAMEPSCVLGGEDTSAIDQMMMLQMLNGPGKKSPKAHSRPADGKLRPGSHTDAVMALSWNSIHRQVIASGSADSTVKIWDVTQAGNDAKGSCNAHHRDKVQSVLWHPKEGTLLVTGSYDRTVAIIDARTNGKNVKKVRIAGDCEAIAWDPFFTEYLTVASEDGTVSCWDVRKFESSTPLWSFVASEYGGVNDLSYNRHVPGLLATCSIDATVTLWDAHPHNNTPSLNAPPRACGNKDMCSGKLYAVSFYPSSPWLMACGGSGNQLALWDLSEEEVIQSRFRSRLLTETPTLGIAPVDQVSQQEEFQAMMADKGVPSPVEKGGKKKSTNKGKSKRKLHRKGR